MIPTKATMITTTTGARLTRKSPKSSPAAEPMRMLGGSPMRVAVPPMFEARIWLIRYGNGETLRVRAIDSVTGVSSTTVVTLSRTAASTAVRTRQDDQQPERLTAREVDRVARHVLEEPGLAEPAGEDHHPGQQEDDVEVDGREGLFLVDDPEDDDEQAAEQGDRGSGRSARRRSARRRPGRRRRRGRRPSSARLGRARTRGSGRCGRIRCEELR